MNIFSGYTNAGFLLYQGLYVISETMVFEIYFDANALILPGYSYAQQIQSISDSKKAYNEIEDDYDDDDD